MKKHICVLLILSVFLSLSQPFVAVSAEMPSSDVLNGYENVCLAYTFDYNNSYNKGEMK